MKLVNKLIINKYYIIPHKYSKHITIVQLLPELEYRYISNTHSRKIWFTGHYSAFNTEFWSFHNSIYDSKNTETKIEI